ncbi:MAG: ribokinase [Alphaproteobacteria bacterium]|nr:ribokinase [Alphaproteobacteria bacterium]
MTLPIIAQIGLPALIKGLAEGLSNVKTPVAQGASAALDQLSASFGTPQMSGADVAELNRHLEKMSELDASRDASMITQVNESLRAEAASNDPYVRRMRPTFGYIIAATWGAQMLALAYVIIFNTTEAISVIAAMAQLGTIWGIGLSVLGIYIYKRSEEKQRNADASVSYDAANSAANEAANANGASSSAPRATASKPRPNSLPPQGGVNE